MKSHTSYAEVSRHSVSAHEVSIVSDTYDCWRTFEIILHRRDRLRLDHLNLATLYQLLKEHETDWDLNIDVDERWGMIKQIFNPEAQP